MSVFHVGRGAELEILERGLAGALRGCGDLFLVLGEAGIGKTTLVKVLAERAVTAGALVLWGRCWENNAAPPFWPWVQILRELARCERLPARLREQAVQLSQALLQSPGPAQGDEDEAGEQARFALFDECWSTLRDGARAQPLVLLIDDLHAADPDSLLLLQYVGREIAAAGILCAVTCRDAEARLHGSMRSSLTSITRLGKAIRLHGLADAEIAEVLQHEFHLEASRETLAEIRKVTEGNPFFLDEIVRLWLAKGILTGFALHTGAIAIPHAVRDVIRGRLQPLPMDVRRLLRCAAVIGRDFDLAGLSHLESAFDATASELAGVAVEAGILERDPGARERFTFSHHLIRETLIDEIGDGERRRLHRLLAEGLERSGALAAEVAYHYAEAGAACTAKAVDCSYAAGRGAMRSLAYESAAALFRSALAHLDRLQPPDARLRCELLLHLGEAYARSWTTDEANETLRGAAEIARRHGYAELLARVALATGTLELGVPRGTANPDVVALLEQALAALGDANEPLRVRLLSRLGVELFYSAESARRDALTRAAVELAERLGDPATLGYASSGRHFAMWSEMPAEERLALADATVRQAELCHDRDLELQGRTWRTLDLIELGDVTALESELALYRQRADELRQPRYRGMSCLFRGLRALWEGRLDDAEALALEAMAIGERGGRSGGFANAGVLIFAVRREQGRLSEVDAFVQAAVARAPHLPTVRCLQALAGCELGRLNDARLPFEIVAANDFQDWWARPWRSSIVGCLAQVCARLGDRRRAAALYALAVSRRGRHCSLGPNAYFGPVDHHLGVLAAAQQQWQTAFEHFEDAARMSRQSGGVPWLIRTLIAHAETATASGSATDAAHDLLDEAIAAATAAGLDAAAGRAGDVRAALGAMPAGPKTAMSHSTRRGRFELEGDFWTIDYAGGVCRLKASKGLRYLAELLRLPDVPVHVFDLAALTESRPDAPAEPVGLEEDGLQITGGGAASAQLDERARAEYRRHLEKLRDLADTARELQNSDRVTELEAEMTMVSRELASGLGMTVQSRSSAVEVLRQNVSRALKTAIDKIAAHNPELGAHLTATIKKGLFCSYNPDHRLPVQWEV